MVKKLIIFMVAMFAALAAADECRAQYDVLKFGDFGVSSIKPKGFKAVRGSVWVEVDNPQVGFTVSEIYGKLYKNGTPMIEGHADDYYVPQGSSRIDITGEASLCPDISIFDVLGLLFFNPEEYTVDIKAIVIDDGAEPVVKEVKDIPVLTLLKKDSEE